MNLSLTLFRAFESVFNGADDWVVASAVDVDEFDAGLYDEDERNNACGHILYLIATSMASFF